MIKPVIPRVSNMSCGDRCKAALMASILAITFKESENFEKYRPVLPVKRISLKLLIIFVKFSNLISMFFCLSFPIFFYKNCYNFWKIQFQ